MTILDRHRLTNPRLFGRGARGEESPESDIDLVVDVPAGVGLLTLARCQAELEAHLEASVDLIPAGDLKEGVAAERLTELLGGLTADTPVVFEAAYGAGWVAELPEELHLEPHLAHPSGCRAIAILVDRSLVGRSSSAAQ